MWGNNFARRCLYLGNLRVVTEQEVRHFIYPGTQSKSWLADKMLIYDASVLLFQGRHMKSGITMTDESTRGASTTKSPYEARPWLKLYPSYIPSELSPQFASGLDMFLATMKAMPDSPAIYYFDQAMSYGELDRKSTALAAALK